MRSGSASNVSKLSQGCGHRPEQSRGLTLALTQQAIEPLDFLVVDRQTAGAMLPQWGLVALGTVPFRKHWVLPDLLLLGFLSLLFVCLLLLRRHLSLALLAPL